MKKRILIGVLALVLALAIAVPSMVPVQASNGPYTLTVTYYANNNPAWGMKNLNVELRTSTGAWKETKQIGLYATDCFVTFTNVPNGDYRVVSTAIGTGSGVAARTDYVTVDGEDTTLDVPVARFRVATVKPGFSNKASVTIRAYAGGRQVEQRGTSTDGYTDFSLLQSADGGNGKGVGIYTFKALVGSTFITETTAWVNEMPPAGLAGVILMIP